MNIVDVVKSRKTCKAYDSSRHLTAEQIEDIKTLLRYSPSSVNSQPWHYVIIESPEAKEKILPGIMEFNRAKVLDSALTIVFAVHNELSDEHISRITQQEDMDQRFLDEAGKSAVDQGRRTFINLNSVTQENLNKWCEKQTYIALGTLLLGAAALNIDATPIEGIIAPELDQSLNLKAKGLRSIVVATLGYSSDANLNAKLPKSRLPEAEIFTIL